MRAAALAIVALIVLATPPASAEPEMTFKLTGVRSGPAATFEKMMREARGKVREWWGATYEGPIAIETTTDRQLSMALIPAWRGQRGSMSFGSKRVDAGDAATVHEMIHVYAPNANRMLAEGLAVYGHEVLGGNAAYPNFGKDLHKTAVAAGANKEILLKLERTPTPAALEEVNKEGEGISGSFVRYLVDTYGMDKFRALYALTPLVQMRRDAGDVARWQQIYGEPLDRLADGWLAALKR
jgi:hypothetical protein